MSIRKKFTKTHIEHFKNNKNLITSDLLDALRSQGNEGKELALEILDTSMNDEKYHTDSFGNKIAFSGNRMLKGQFVQMDLSDIHKAEIKRCFEDIHYFRANYVKMATKDGVTFPDLREYQKNFIDMIMDDTTTDIVTVQPRRAGKTLTTGIVLLHYVLFKEDITIGICANRGATAREFLDAIKKMYIHLPMWMKIGQIVWNKGSVEFDNNVRILTDVPSSDSFRGFQPNCLVIDESAFIKPSVWEDFADSCYPSQGALSWRKNFLISTPNGINFFHTIVEGAKKKKEINNVQSNELIELENGSTITIKDYFERQNIR